MAKKNHYHFVLQKEDIESGLKEHMDELAAQKKLTAKIKTALTLLAQLEKGNYELLDSLFPEARKSTLPPPPTPIPAQLDKRLDRIEKLLEQGGGNIIPVDAPMVGKSIVSPPTKPSLTAGAGSTLGGGRKLSLPPLDDDDSDTLVINKTTGSKNGGNLFGSILGIIS